jgi:hypothetical protein
LQELKQVQMKQLQRRIVLLLPLLVLTISYSDAVALRLHATHADAGRGLTKRELLYRMAARSKARSMRLLSGHAARVDPGPYADSVPDTEYLVHLSIGTPPQPVHLSLDTGSDLVWTQCQPCQACFDQALPYFDPFDSSTFSVLPCHQPMCQQNLDWSSCGKQYWGN